MIQDYRVTGQHKETENHVYTLSRQQAIHYANTMNSSGKWDQVSIWKDGKEYKSNEWSKLP